MFYQYFRIFNWISTLFGVRKPFITSSGKPSRISVLNKLWSLSVAITIIITFSFYVTIIINTSKKRTLDIYSKTNNVLVDIIIIASNTIAGEKICIHLYTTINNTFSDLKITNKSLKLISLKLYLWLLIPTLMYVITIILEIVTIDPPFYVLLSKTPTYLTIVHLSFHLYLILAVLNVVNNKIEKLNIDNNTTEVLNPELEKYKPTKYLFDCRIRFIEVNEKEHFDLQMLCKVYDSLGTCVQLLEKLHGFQILVTIWSMFTTGVFGAAIVVCKQDKFPWLVVIRGLLPFSWCLMGSYIDDQLRKAVEWTEILLVKYLIDFRCDQPRKHVLETFKQLVNTHRLRFKASGLFHLGYSMMLGTIVNVITYGIILIQLVLESS